ncbi:MAG: [FeFe] hydrogenase H-cluster radical SAM maturase HydG [Desulfovibrio sp. S3730MH75]|nr:MAG: [FeFe] hydrogenase H-cluster radical SAM maturase HydG [Desulfovibrio sp. S3730MH75]
MRQNSKLGGSLESFIDEDLIWAEIDKATDPDPALVRDILAKARERKGLSPFEAAVLLKNTDKDLDNELFSAAIEVKKGIYGEHPKLDAEWIAQIVRDVYDVASRKSGEIRRVNINCAPLDVEGFKTLNEAGIDDVGMGVLFGLFDPVFEVMGLLYHALQLEKDWGVGPHTISFPRLEPALGAEIAFNPPYLSSDHDFKKIVSVLRLVFPYAGLILTTRENSELRAELLEVGVTQLSAGSRTYPGAYSDPEFDRPDVQQFCVGDNRSLDEVIQSIVSEHGYIPSWCTACYRLGRTGKHFMDLAKTGFIQKFCLPNGLLTFKEYLEDYGSDETKRIGEEFLRNEIKKYIDPKQKKLVEDRLARMEKGERDLYI